MKLNVSRDGLPILDQFSEEGFVDCVFKIIERTDLRGLYKLTLSASFADQPVSVIAVVRSEMNGAITDTGLVAEHIYRPAVTFQSTGDQSDRLVRVLAHLYGLPDHDLAMIDALGFTGIPLHAPGEVDMMSDPIKVKLFAHDSDAEPGALYSESYFNLDLASGFVFWNEKDPEYREPLVRGLTAHCRLPAV